MRRIDPPGLVDCVITLAPEWVGSHAGGVMKRVFLPLLAALATVPLIAAEHPDTTGWQGLIAADLSNTVEPGKWTMTEGVLVAGDGRTLWSKESYGDFILDLEFKVAKDANSGVFLRCGDIKNILSALEIQIHESADGTPKGMIGALYDAAKPTRNMAKPSGEWNRFTITCKGPQLTLVFNGEKVLDLNLDDWREPQQNPDGTPNKFAVALKDFARKGPIGLQGLHGKEQAPVYFRKLRIKRLD